MLLDDEGCVSHSSLWIFCDGWTCLKFAFILIVFSHVCSGLLTIHISRAHFRNEWTIFWRDWVVFELKIHSELEIPWKSLFVKIEIFGIIRKDFLEWTISFRIRNHSDTIFAPYRAYPVRLQKSTPGTKGRVVNGVLERTRTDNSGLATLPSLFYQGMQTAHCIAQISLLGSCSHWIPMVDSEDAIVLIRSFDMKLKDLKWGNNHSWNAFYNLEMSYSIELCVFVSTWN